MVCVLIILILVIRIILSILIWILKLLLRPIIKVISGMKVVLWLLICLLFVYHYEIIISLSRMSIHRSIFSRYGRVNLFLILISLWWSRDIKVYLLLERLIIPNIRFGLILIILNWIKISFNGLIRVSWSLRRSWLKHTLWTFLFDRSELLSIELLKHILMHVFHPLLLLSLLLHL